MTRDELIESLGLDNGGLVQASGQWLLEGIDAYVAAEREKAWDEGSRAGWSDRTKSFMERRTYEQEVANATPNPYRRGGESDGE